MAAIGETLRQARLRLGVDLNQVAQKTKINRRFLEAIEAGDFDKLPGGVFARMFVKQYADALGLDGASFAEELQKSSTVVDAEPDLQTIAETHVSFHPKVQSFDSVGDRVRSERLNSMLSSLIWVVVVILVCSGAYYGLGHLPKQFTFGTSSSSEPAETAPVEKASTPVAHPASNPATPPAAVTPQAATPEATPANPAAPNPTPAAQPQAVPATPTGGATLQLSLVATAQVWVSATADGKRVFSGVLEPGTSKIISASALAKLTIGNAGALEVTCNGKKYEPFGPSGQVRNVEFTPQGAQVVSRTPPPTPDSPR
jgi:cytoskeleton protein RodZ